MVALHKNYDQHAHCRVCVWVMSTVTLYNKSYLLLLLTFTGMICCSGVWPYNM